MDLVKYQESLITFTLNKIPLQKFIYFLVKIKFFEKYIENSRFTPIFMAIVQWLGIVEQFV